MSKTRHSAYIYKTPPYDEAAKKTKDTMPDHNFPQNQSQSQAADAASAQTQLDSLESGADPLKFLLSRQKFVALLKKFKVSRVGKINMRLLVTAVLLTTASPHLSYGTVNGYDIVDIAGHYNSMAEQRNLPQVSAQAIEYQIKKEKFADLMQAIFEHVTEQAASFGLELSKIKQVLTLISELTVRPIVDIVADDGCYFTGHDSLAKVFPASRTAHKEGSKGAAQIGLQARYSLKGLLFTSMEITGGNAYEPNYGEPEPNTIALKDAAYSSFVQFIRCEEKGAYQVSAGRKNLAAKVRRAYVDGKEVKDIQGKAPKEFLRYDPRQSVELIIEGTTKTEFTIVVDSKGVATKVPHNITLRAIRIFDPRKGATWVLTNLPEAVPAESVLYLMRLRWGIERAFLDLKSHNNLRGARTSSKALTRTLVWASLITALLKGFTIRCAERLYGRELSLRGCHKLDQYNQETHSWSAIVITLTCSCALPFSSFTEVLQKLGTSKLTGKCKPSSKNQRRSLAHHIDSLIFELAAATSKGKLLLPYKPCLNPDNQHIYAVF